MRAGLGTKDEGEANALADVDRMSRGFVVQEAASTYARLVIQDEWPAMARGESSPIANAGFSRVVARIHGHGSKGTREWSCMPNR